MASALAAVAAMVVTGVLQWDEVLCNEDGWDTVIWLGGLVSMAGAANGNIWHWPHIYPAHVTALCSTITPGRQIN